MRRIHFYMMALVLLGGCRATGAGDESRVREAVAGEVQVPEPPRAVYGLHDFGIAGFEYWPWITGRGNPHAENRVQFGFGNASSQAAQECTRIAYEILYRILSHPPANLVKLRDDTNAPTQFFLWNNDYTRFNANYGATIYNWENSYIKWQHYTDRDGRCFVPSRKSLDDFAACEWRNKTNDLGRDCENSDMYEASTIDMATQMPR